MKLRARTPAGTELLIDVRLSGYLRVFSNDVIDRAEIYMPPKEYIECDGIELDELRLRRCLWVEPRELCMDDGSDVTIDALRAEVARVLEQQRIAAARGPLGEYWL